MTDFLSSLGSIPQHLSLLWILLTGLLHLLYAAGIAKDIGNLEKRSIQPLFLPGIGWVLAALLGGIFTVLVYWLIHHSTLSKK
jgi:hypothetical protein